MTAERDIDYEALVQTAMRGMVRTLLQRVAKEGLPGEHHFYIAFSTRAPGVVISKRLKEKYPEEMTIVLQHRFWDLTVMDDRFEVKLTFDAIPERLVIPFGALRVFWDPSVQFGHQFEQSEFAGDAPRRPSHEEDDAETTGTRGQRSGGRSAVNDRSDRKRPAAQRKLRTEKPAAPTPVQLAEDRAPTAEPEAAPVPLAKPAAAEPSAAPAKVISLDQFRKK